MDAGKGSIFSENNENSFSRIVTHFLDEIKSMILCDMCVEIIGFVSEKDRNLR